MNFPEAAVGIIGHNRDSDVVITCDHASNHVPAEIGDLGLTDAEMARHIAYDVGAAGVSRHLGELLNAPVILSGFSRLVIDPNRGEHDPTLIMQLYDGTIIPGNRRLSQGARNWRLENCYHPYHKALTDLLASRNAPKIIAIHSFTAQLAGRAKRPWHVGVLHEGDRQLSIPMLARLRQEPDLCVGENEPYGGHLPGDAIDRHALKHNRANILIELRNDLIRSKGQQVGWAERLAPMLADVIAKIPDEMET
ncbi:MAG: N-formylglutamate amidohydrolase [Alphaproteobacteria bacterium]|nr:N-formylglutamate amidohydrolase [Alphaproteobacteria bacterium]